MDLAFLVVLPHFNPISHRFVEHHQLEHQLFPSMPRSKYPKLRRILQKFAKDNGIPGAVVERHSRTVGRYIRCEPRC